MTAALNGQIALVTGSSRGIGKAIAAKLLEMGADVIVSGSQEKTLGQTAAELGGCRYIAADLTQPASIEKLALQAGGVDILVNNAGITRDGLFLRQREEDWEEVLRVNLAAAVQLTRMQVPHMIKKRRGRIVNISSVAAYKGTVGQTNYITSKAALHGFTIGLAQEVARRGVTVNCVAPGFIETKMTLELPESVRQTYLENIPAHTFGTPEDVAAAVGFLASPDARYITGTTLHVNGGLYM